MQIFSKKVEFSPEPISKFRGEGFGYLQLVDWAFDSLSIEMKRLHDWIDNVESGEWHGEESNPRLIKTFPVDLFGLYVGWTCADIFLTYLQIMPKKDREDHQKLAPDLNEDDLRKKFSELSGILLAEEGRQPQIFDWALQEQIASQIMRWIKMIAWAEEDPANRPRVMSELEMEDMDLEPEDPNRIPDQTVQEFCNLRTALEAVLLGVTRIQFVTLRDKDRRIEQRLSGVNLDSLEDVTEALDHRFHRLLKGYRHTSEFWFDESFWWLKKDGLPEEAE